MPEEVPSFDGYRGERKKMVSKQKHSSKMISGATKII